MIGKGLFHADVGVVGRSLTPRPGQVVIGVFYGEAQINTYRRKGEVILIRGRSIIE